MKRQFFCWVGGIFFFAFSVAAWAVTGIGYSQVGVIDTDVPVFSSFSVSPPNATSGDTVTVTFYASEPLLGIPTVTVVGNPATYVSGSYPGAYTYQYVVSPSDPLGNTAVQVTGYDVVGNLGSNFAPGPTIIPAATPLNALGYAALCICFIVMIYFAVRRLPRRALWIMLWLVVCSAAWGAAPTVSNVTFVQQPKMVGGTEVVITYDLTAPNGPCTISLWLSWNGGADGFPTPITAVTGAVSGVTTGVGHVIVWDVATEVPGLYVPNAQIKLVADDGTTTFYKDADGDTFGDCSDFVNAVAPVAPYTATVCNDCNDSNPSVNPGATETCNGIDDNCDGLVDPEGSAGAAQYYLDADGDGYGVWWDSKWLCAPIPMYSTLTPGDCDDANAQIHPGAPEKCSTWQDDDCDGLYNEENAVGCTTYYWDWDGDGYGLLSNSKCLCAPMAPYQGLTPGDCDDANPIIYPGAFEICDGLDDNCDGITDPPGTIGGHYYYYDNDGDGYGDPNMPPLWFCAPQPPYYTALTGNDCDDTEPQINPGAQEVCGDGKDNDCDGVVDQAVNAIGCSLFYYDWDYDGYGDSSIPPLCACAPCGWSPGCYALFYTAPVAGDCAPYDPSIHPGAPETCNGLDDNCDGNIDEGCP
jgi:hypothetical protein